MKKSIYVTLDKLVQKLHINLMTKLKTSDSLSLRNEQIAREFYNGHSLKSLAKKHSLSENRISQVLTAHGARQPKWRKMSTENRRLVFQMQKKGLSKAAIGRKVGVSRERVRQILSQKSL